MSTPVNDIAGLPCISDGSENWLDFITTITACYNKVPVDVGVGYYEMYGRSVVLLRKPEYVTQVLKNNVAHYLWGGIGAAAICFFGDKVMFVVEDDEWRQLRRVMSPELRTQIDVPKFIEDMNRNANILAAKFQREDGAVVDLVQAMRAFHLSSAGRAMFNVDLQCVETYPAQNAITNAFAYFLQQLPIRSFSQDMGVQQDYKTPNEDNKKMWEASKAVHDVILDVLKNRLAGKGSSRNDMLHQMMSAFKKEHGKDVSALQIEQALGANLVELLFAGYNTVVNTIASALFVLAENPKALQKLRDEFQRVLGSRDMKAEDVDKLPYLNCVFKETLRLYPPAPAIARRLGRDEKLGNITLPKDAEVMFSMSGLHYDSENWKDADKFMPERFMNPIKDGSFVPFSDGPRSCIGQHFAKFEFFVTLTNLLRKFDFEPAKDYKFGMMFNGFGWMAADLSNPNPYAGSCVKVKVKAKQQPGPSKAVLACIGLQVAAVAYAFSKK